MHHSAPHACSEYNALSRRNFLKAGGTAAAMMAAAPAWLPRVAFARDHRGSQRDVIISVYLRGAADGLSLVPPCFENAYYAARPLLNVPRFDSASPNRAINLDGQFGMAPSLAPLQRAYQEGNLLFVHACGLNDATRSHFDGQKFMELGKPRDDAVVTGWLGRHLESVSSMQPGALLRGVAIDTGLHRSLIGAPRTLPVPSPASFGLQGDPFTESARLAALGGLYAGQGRLDLIAQNTMATVELLQTINFVSYPPAGGAVYPTSYFGQGLRSAAAMIKAQVGVEAISIDVDGWDTHFAQGTLTGFLSGLMSTFAQALAAFYADMTAGSSPPGFTLIAMSEFGRRLAENGTGGTDHGHANVMTIMGRCVNGGQVLTQWPGMAPENLFEGTDLEVTIDFRDVLAEIVEGRLGNSNLDYVFPGHQPTMRGVIAC